MIGAGIEVHNAGAGFSDAMKVDPVLLNHGDVVYVVIETEVSKVRYDEVVEGRGEDREVTGELLRVHMLRATSATLVDKELVGDAIAAQKDRIQAAKDAAAGQERLDLEAEEQRLADDEDDD